jgi:AI-2 transport protein TqsA
MSAVLILLVGIAVVFNVLAGQADAVTQAWPRYIERLNIMGDQLLRWAGPQAASKVAEAVSNLDVIRQIPGLVGSAGGFVVTVVLVTIYVGFLLAERGQLSGKIGLLFSNTEHAGEMQSAVTGIGESIRRYLWIKTIMSLLTSGVSYGVLRTVGVDFAETWALIIFLLNYIPSIGAIIGVVFPALLALVQFETLWQFFIISALLAAAQLIIGNIIEPSLMGRTLNLSPFVVIASLAFWAMIWGIVGAFLSVPLTTALIIVCSHMPSLRWVAVLLSADSRTMLGGPALGASAAPERL